MTSQLQPRVAILGPIETAPFRTYLPGMAGDTGVPRGMGGSNIVHLVLARLEQNRQTDVITVDPGSRKPIERYEGPLLRLWIVRRRSARSMRDMFREERRLLGEALQESSPEICHANWTFEYGLTAVSQKKIPHVVSVHDHAGNMLRHAGWRYLPLYAMSRRVLKQARCLTAVSPYIANYVQTLTRRDVTIIPNLLSSFVWSRARTVSHARPLRIISALTWATFRNAKTALRAFAQIRSRRTDLEYIIIGPGFEENGPAHRWAVENSCADKVIFKGRIPHAEALDMIGTSSLLLHPSLEESFGSPVAEAMALECPVVTAQQACGPRWLLEDGRLGALFDGRNEKQLVNVLERELSAIESSDSSLIVRLKAAREKIEQLCSSQRVLAEWDKLYAKLKNGNCHVR